jgi:RNA polymerase sigma factor (sigma-70 family)
MATVTYGRLSDFQLLTLHRDGDDEAFAEIHNRYAPHVYRYVRWRLDRRNEQYVDDIVQDVFVAVLAKARTHDLRRYQLLRYILRATKWACFAAVNNAGISKAKHVSTYKAIPAEDTACDVAEYVNVYLQDEQRRALIFAMSHLSPRERDVYLRRDIRGDTPQEIAEELGLGVTSVHVYMTQAYNRLAWIYETGSTTGAALASKSHGLRSTRSHRDVTVQRTKWGRPVLVPKTKMVEAFERAVVHA